MKQTTSSEKIKNSKPLTDSALVMLFKDLLRPALRFLIGLTVDSKQRHAFLFREKGEVES